jgi:hypothetical protein
LAALLAGPAPSWAAETFGYTSRKPQIWETQPPVLEEDPGTNLYWHDPLLGSWEMCRAWPPATNGCPPSWYGKVDMLALFRDPKRDYTLATLGPGGGIALSTNNFRSEFDAGLRATVGKTLGDWYRVEGVYFGSYNWNDTVAVRNFDINDEGGAGNLFSPFSNFGSPEGFLDFDYNDFVSLRFSSRMNNGELNIRRRVLMRPGCYETSFLMGARYMDIREQFDYLSESTTLGPGVTSNAVAISTTNRLFGAQIGLLSQFLIQPRCWIDFEMKGAIFTNNANLSRVYTIDDGIGAIDTFSGTDGVNRTSFVGDLSLQCNYQVAPFCTVYGGYNALWVTGLALGPDNFENETGILTLGPTLIDHRGQLVYHGPNFGIVLAY